MERFVCTVCGYIYDEREGEPAMDVLPGTPFDQLPDAFVCPLCGVGKEMFERE